MQVQAATSRGRQRGTFATAFSAYLEEQKPAHTASIAASSSARLAVEKDVQSPAHSTAFAPAAAADIGNASVAPLSLSLPPRGEPWSGAAVSNESNSLNSCHQHEDDADRQWSPIADDTLVRLSHALRTFERNADLSSNVAYEAALDGQPSRGRGMSHADSASRKSSRSTASSGSLAERNSDIIDEGDAEHATRWIHGTLRLMHEHAVRHSSPRSVQQLEKALLAAGIQDVPQTRAVGLRPLAMPAATAPSGNRVSIASRHQPQQGQVLEKRAGDTAVKLEASDFLFSVHCSL